MLYSRKILLIILILIPSLVRCDNDVSIQNEGQGPKISIESFYPDSGVVGTMVTIMGDNFQNQRDISKIVLDENEFAPYKVSEQEISFIIPETIAEGTYEIKLKGENTDFKIEERFKVFSDVRNVVNEDVLSYNYVLGTQSFDPKYSFTQQDGLIETANAILDMGSNILKISLNAQKYGLDFNGDATSLIQEHPSFKKVLDMPFSYYFFWVGTHSKWRDGYSEQERKTDSTLISDLTIYLREEFNQSGKQFYLGHWEGDWYLLPGYDVDHKPTDTSIQGMIQYYNARQNALEEALRITSNSDVKVYQYAEVNRVVDAMEGKKRLTNYVLPYSNVDYVSYSAYDGQMKSREQFHAILDFIEAHLPEKEGIEGKRVFVGEYARPAKLLSFSKFEHESENRDIMLKAITWGAPFILYWEMYNNEVDNNEHTGFWLVDHTGVKWPFYYTHNMTLLASQRWVQKFKNEFQRLPSRTEYLDWLQNALSQ